MQVNSLSAQLELGTEPVDWYRDATSVPYRQLLVAWLSRTGDRLRYCTITGSICSTIFTRERMNLWAKTTQKLSTL